MSDAIRVALESAIRTYESMSPGVITAERKQAIEALQALQSREPVAYTTRHDITLLKSHGWVTVYEKLQKFVLLPQVEMIPLYTAQQAVVPEGFSLIANEILDRFPEINSSNYSHDDVDRLNAWGIELVLSAVTETV